LATYFEYEEWDDKQVREFFTMRSAQLVKQDREDLRNWIVDNRQRLRQIGWRPQLQVVQFEPAARRAGA
jgi:hypothetical protein